MISKATEQISVQAESLGLLLLILVLAWFEGLGEGFVRECQSDLSVAGCCSGFAFAVTAAEADLHAADLGGLFLIDGTTGQRALGLDVLASLSELPVGLVGELGGFLFVSGLAVTAAEVDLLFLVGDGLVANCVLAGHRAGGLEFLLALLAFILLFVSDAGHGESQPQDHGEHQKTLH